MIGAAQRRVGNPPPTAGDRPVDVAEEQVADIVVRRQDLAHSVSVGAQPDSVQAGKFDAEWRVVHEQVDGPVLRVLEGPPQPRQPPGAVAAPPFSRFDGVEHQEPSGAGLHRRLHEPVRVEGCFRECLEKTIAPIVIADQQAGRHPQLRQTLAQLRVGFRPCGMREITGDYAELGISMVAIDVGDARCKAVMRIESVQLFAARLQVRVGDVDEFHGASRGRGGISPSRLATA